MIGKKLPIPDVPLDQQKPIIALVDQILAEKSANAALSTSETEAEIDQIVYELYGLTEEDIAVVEGWG